VKRRPKMFLTLVGGVGAALTSVWCAWRAPVLPEPPRLGLSLLVNGQSHVEVTPGTPLVFELSLGSSAFAPAFDVGSRWRPWSTLGRVEHEATRTMPWALTKVGERSVHVTRRPDGRQSVTMGSGAIARFEDGREVYTAVWTLAPEDSSRIGPGTYRVRGIVETPFWLMWGWTGRAASPLATIVVRGPEQSTSVAHAAQRNAAIVDYYLGLGRFAEARAAAIELVRMQPTEATGHVRLGDALAGLNRKSEALGAYQLAISLLPRSSEEPTLIHKRIDGVRR
jgi:hypothetical protein